MRGWPVRTVAVMAFGLLMMLGGLGDGAALSAAARHPGRAGLLLFAAGLDAGLLTACGLSRFWWWWALGALLFTGALAVALYVAAISHR